ncbi:MAG TPA: DciA family protein [Tepidisphaeraceae bacterium]|jgi:hypothetical protein|nr:DciA family protein [Tepidisphaeraceae bacterium]
MPLNPQQHLDATLRRLARVKHRERKPIDPLGPEMVAFFKESVQKRQTKLAKVADCWGKLVPPSLNEHCSLESLSRGTLVVLVDTSSHLYDLKQLLLAGLQQQILLACASAGLKKITLKSGRWYDDGGAPGDRRPKFD